MLDYLAKRISYPLEREFEAWIIQQIDEFFRRLSIPVHIFAVSPFDEATWPVDEVVGMNGKVIGLQFKRPALGPDTQMPNDFNRIYWDLSSPVGQLKRLVANDWIFYCLPTFMNRKVRDEALRHCLFWRPTNADDRGAWYYNSSPRVRTKHAKVCDAPRWGLFVEQFLSCQIGLPIDGISFSEVMRRFRRLPPIEPQDERDDQTTIQILLLQSDAGN